MSVHATIRVTSATKTEVEEFARFSSSQSLPQRVCDVEHIEWKHLRCPLGASTAIDLVENNEVRGRLWVTFRHWRLGNQIVVMGHPQDLLVDQQHRLLKDIVRLIEEAFSNSLDDSGIMYHGSNPNSEGLYRRIFRSKPILNLRASVVPLSPTLLIYRFLSKKRGDFNSILDLGYRRFLRVLNSMLNRKTILKNFETINDLEDVFIKFEECEPCSAVRSREYFEWRFNRDKSSPYVVKLICVNNQTVGYTVWSDTSAFGFRARVLIDIVWLEKRTWFNRLRFCLSIATHSNNDVDLIVFISNHNNSTLRKLSSFPMIVIPRSMMPQAIPIFLRFEERKIGKSSSIIEDYFGRCYFTMSDLDFF